jgi:Glycosyl hydrolases family 16.
MNLFGKIIFRKLKSTEVFEKEKDDLLRAYERYVAIGNSELLREYKALRKEVKSAEFKENKKVLINRKFKDTEEYRNWKKFHKLERNGKLHRYYAIAASKELSAFLDFKKTPQYEFIGNKVELKKSEMLREFRAYEKSGDYKLYTRFHDSYIVKEYERLKGVVSSKEFIQFKEFWSDPHRWTKTEAYKQEEKFRQLSQHTDIVFYQRTDSASFAFHANWKLAFNDEFNGVSLDRNIWDSGYYFSDATLIRDYSLNQHNQANNEGKNVSVADGCMVIETLKEETRSRAWDEKLGFVFRDFAYTSDVINAGAAFQFSEGIVETKLKIRDGYITHVFSLVCENKLPQINVFHFDGKHVTVGNAWKGGSQTEVIKGISPADFYIYKMEWTSEELIWSVNNLEVFRTRKGVPSLSLFPLFASMVDKEQDDTGALEVDWVRIYQRRKA